MFEITRQFFFDAAHYMPHMQEGHAYRQVHGHSFRVQVTLRGNPSPGTGWVMDFAVLDALLEEVRGELDHRLLNEIGGLSTPTLENICLWLRQRLAGHLPGLARITVARDSIGQSCTLSCDPEN